MGGRTVDFVDMEHYLLGDMEYYLMEDRGMVDRQCWSLVVQQMGDRGCWMVDMLIVRVDMEHL